MAITDRLDAAVLPAGESFATVRAAGFSELLRGVAFAPNSLDNGQGTDNGNH